MPAAAPGPLSRAGRYAQAVYDSDSFLAVVISCHCFLPISQAGHSGCTEGRAVTEALKVLVESGPKPPGGGGGHVLMPAPGAENSFFNDEICGNRACEPILPPQDQARESEPSIHESKGIDCTARSDCFGVDCVGAGRSRWKRRFSGTTAFPLHAFATTLAGFDNLLAPQII